MSMKACKFRVDGASAQSSKVGLTMRSMNKKAGRLTADEVSTQSSRVGLTMRSMRLFPRCENFEGRFAESPTALFFFLFFSQW